MKKIQFFAFLVISAISFSCSSDSSSDSSNNNPPADSGALSVNGTSVTLSSKFAQRGDNTLAISAYGSDDSSLQLLFDAFGNLESADYDDAEGNSYRSFKHFNSNYFTFNLLSIDSANKTVAVSYSGKVYNDEEDLTSEFKTISGSFNLTYILNTPSVSGLGLACKIAGNNWHSTQSWDNGIDYLDRKFISSDANLIALSFPYNVTTGTYTFNSSSTFGCRLAKYNTSTNSYTFYNCVGSFIITNVTPGFLYSIIEGTFSFTATNPTNPSQTITVSEGTFKTNVSG